MQQFLCIDSLVQIRMNLIRTLYSSALGLLAWPFTIKSASQQPTTPITKGCLRKLSRSRLVNKPKYRSIKSIHQDSFSNLSQKQSSDEVKKRKQKKISKLKLRKKSQKFKTASNEKAVTDYRFTGFDGVSLSSINPQSKASDLMDETERRQIQNLISTAKKYSGRDSAIIYYKQPIHNLKQDIEVKMFKKTHNPFYDCQSVAQKMKSQTSKGGKALRIQKETDKVGGDQNKQAPKIESQNSEKIYLYKVTKEAIVMKYKGL